MLVLGQRGALVESKNIFGDSLLAKAFDEGTVKLFEAVLNCAWGVLDHHQVLLLLPCSSWWC